MCCEGVFAELLVQRKVMLGWKRLHPFVCTEVASCSEQPGLAASGTCQGPSQHDTGGLGI